MLWKYNTLNLCHSDGIMIVVQPQGCKLVFYVDFLVLCDYSVKTVYLRATENSSRTVKCCILRARIIVVKDWRLC